MDATTHDPPTLTRADIANGFRRLGFTTGDVVLLHSSLRSFGYVAGGADAVIDGILDALGPEGTLVVPTLTGSIELSAANPPHIDIRTTPCWTGAIPEAVRHRPEAIRSVHPTHSCTAIGKRAEELTRDHYISPTPCGLTSPYFRVALAGGYIVMAGCTLASCTTLHAVEELAGSGYRSQDAIAFGSCIDSRGVRIETPVLLHAYEAPQADFPVMEPILLERGLMRIGKIGSSTVRVVKSMHLIEAALEKVRFDKYFLTTSRGRKG